MPLNPAADKRVGGTDLQMAVGHCELRCILEPNLVTLGADFLGDLALDQTDAVHARSDHGQLLPCVREQSEVPYQLSLMLAAIHGAAGSSLNWNSAGRKLHVALGEINMQKWSSQRRFNQVFG
jgi:hypothetical protein